VVVAEFSETGLPQDVIVGDVTRKRSHTRRWAFLGMLPFVAFITMFLLIPTGEIIVGAFRTVNGAFTLSNIDDIFHAPYPAAFRVLGRAFGAQRTHRRHLRIPAR